MIFRAFFSRRQLPARIVLYMCVRTSFAGGCERESARLFTRPRQHASALDDDDDRRLIGLLFAEVVGIFFRFSGVKNVLPSEGKM